jgi:hypothetical protein
MGYKTTRNLVTEVKSDLLVSSNILNRQKITFNYIVIYDLFNNAIINSGCIVKRITCQLLNVHGVKNVRQTETHTAELLVLEYRSLKVLAANEKFKRYKRGTR